RVTTSSLAARPPPLSISFPYTTLFRSRASFRARLLHPAPQPEGGGARARTLPHRRAAAEIERPCAQDCPRDELYRRRNGRIPSRDRKSTRLNSSHVKISYAVFCLKKKR